MLNDQEQTIYAFEFEDDEVTNETLFSMSKWMDVYSVQLRKVCHLLVPLLHVWICLDVCQARDTFALCLGMFVDQRRSEAEVRMYL